MLGEKLNQIPVLYTRGNNYTIGYSIGRQFKYLIEDTICKCQYLQESLIPVYETKAGKKLYQNSLQVCQRNFPEYVREIEGMANGASLPFYKLFLLNLEVFQTSPAEAFEITDQEGSGCSDILSNGEQLILAHNEDIGPELLNNIFIVSAEVLGPNGEKEYKFTSLTYAGYLPGYTMGYNEHGFIHTINTLCPLDTLNEKSPRYFITRSLLKAKNLEEVVKILKDKGTGVSDGFSLNACFVKTPSGVPEMYNIEVGTNKGGDESMVDVLEIKPGDTYAHCNMYLRLPTPQLEKASVRSGHRHRAIEKHPKPETVNIIRDVLSDRSDPEFPVYRSGDTEHDKGITVVVGLFDVTNREWNIYSQPPNESTPIAVLPLSFLI